MINWLIQIDTDVFLFLNGLHSSWLDPIMFQLTKQLVWTPLFAFVIYALFKNHKKDAWWYLLGIAFVILFSDQLISSFMKPYFGRLRPSHQPELEGLVHLVNNYRGGLYGFASSHAGNSFGVAFFLWLSTRSTIRWIGWMFAWAAIFSYTRIYLGVHFPGDIFVGALVGMCIGFMVSEGIALVRSRAFR